MSDDVVAILLASFGEPGDLEEYLMRVGRPQKRRRRSRRAQQQASRRPSAAPDASDPRFRWVPDGRPERAGQVARRYIGRGVRGRQPPAIEDAADLGVALRSLATATEQLIKAHSRVIPTQRKAEIAAAVGMLALVGRMLDEIIVRRGGTPGDVGSPEGGQ